MDEAVGKFKLGSSRGVAVDGAGMLTWLLYARRA